MVKIWEWLDDLADRIWTGISAPLYDLRDWADDTLADKLSLGILDTLEKLEDELLKVVIPLIDMVLEYETIPPTIREYFVKLKTKFAPIQLALLIPFAVGAVMYILPSVMAGFLDQIRQESLKRFKPTLLSPTDSVLGYWRGKLSREQMYDEMSQMGYNQERTDTIEEVNRFVPGPSDLIRFSVRDVFRPDVVEKYGYDTDFDKMEKEIEPWTKKVGMDTDTLKQYWRAHWDLPSLTSAFEMFHRGLITEEDIKELLRINDMSPYYIDNLVKIAYKPYTRVDIRRMYSAGVLNREQVKTAYKDLGYDDEKAENLTKFTVKSSMPAEKDLSKTELITLFNAGQITQAQAVEGFGKIGYDPEESENLIKLEEARKEQKYKDREKKIISNQYYYGQISRQEAEKALNTLNVTEREKITLLSEVEARIREKHRSPTKADLEQWLKKDLITETEFVVEMENLGYAIRYIELYIKEIKAS